METVKVEKVEPTSDSDDVEIVEEKVGKNNSETKCENSPLPIETIYFRQGISEAVSELQNFEAIDQSVAESSKPDQSTKKFFKNPKKKPSVNIKYFQIAQPNFYVKHLQIAKPSSQSDASLVKKPKYSGGQRIYDCVICSEVFKTPGDLGKHLISHDDKSVNCDYCDENFSSQDTLEQHISFCHLESKPYVCTTCTKTFDSKIRLFYHKLGHKKPNNECSICGQIFNRVMDLSFHMQIHSKEKIHKCHICPEKFLFETELNVHLETHNTLKCSICSKTFSSLYLLNKHVLRHKVKNTQCFLCKKTFRSKVYLQVHMKDVHNESSDVDSEYECEYCKESFDNKSYLVTHIKSHIDVLPYQCYICQKEFNSKSALNGHMRVHKDLYRCHICDKAFSQNFFLQKHLRVHAVEPYQCYYCKKLFKEKYHFEFHMEEVHSILT